MTESTKVLLPTAGFGFVIKFKLTFQDVSSSPGSQRRIQCLLAAMASDALSRVDKTRISSEYFIDFYKIKLRELQMF